MKIKKKMRNVINFLLWTLIYVPVYGILSERLIGLTPFYLGAVIVDGKAGFNPFYDWSVLYTKFMRYDFVVDDLQTLFIFLSFFLFVPMWLIGWWLLRKKFNIFKLIALPAIMRRKKELSQAKPKIEHKSFGRPMALRASLSDKKVRARRENTPQQAQSAPQAPTEPSQGEPKPKSIPRRSDEEHFVIEYVKKVGENFGFEGFENVLLGGFVVPVVLATDSEAILVVDLFEDKQWVADEKEPENGGVPQWFSPNGLCDSPVANLKKAAAALSEAEPLSHISSVVLVAKGQILNIDTMLAGYEAAGVKFLRCIDGKPETLPLFENFVKDISENALSFKQEESEEAEQAPEPQPEEEPAESAAPAEGEYHFEAPHYYSQQPENKEENNTDTEEN